jgi:hypothetical protein
MDFDPLSLLQLIGSCRLKSVLKTNGILLGLSSSFLYQASCHGSLSLLFVMKVMVCHFVSDSHEITTALIVVLPIIVVVEISLQLHQAFF